MLNRGDVVVNESLSHSVKSTFTPVFLSANVACLGINPPLLFVQLRCLLFFPGVFLGYHTTLWHSNFLGVFTADIYMILST